MGSHWLCCLYSVVVCYYTFWSGVAGLSARGGRTDKPQHHDKRCDKMFITVDWSLLGNSRVHKPTSEFQIAVKETMAEAFHLEVDGWDSEQDSTPLQDSVSENSSPGNEQSAKRRKTQHKF